MSRSNRMRWSSQATWVNCGAPLASPTANTPGAGLVVVAGYDETAFVEIDARFVTAEVVGVRPAAGGDEQVAALDVPTAFEPNRHASAPSRTLSTFAPSSTRMPSVAKNGFDFARYLRVLGMHQVLAVLEDRDLGAEAAKHLRKLAADVASAENDEMLGRRFELHHAVVVEPRHRFESRDASEPRGVRRRSRRRCRRKIFDQSTFHLARPDELRVTTHELEVLPRMLDATTHAVLPTLDHFRACAERRRHSPR